MLNDWEIDFLASVGSLSDPTPRQQEVLDEIEAEIPVRLKLAREGRLAIRRR